METIQDFISDVNSFMLEFKNTSKPYVANGLKVDWLNSFKLIRDENWSELKAYSENRKVEIETKLAYYPPNQAAINDLVTRFHTHEQTIKDTVNNLPEDVDDQIISAIDESDYSEGVKLDMKTIWLEKFKTSTRAFNNYSKAFDVFATGLGVNQNACLTNLSFHKLVLNIVELNTAGDTDDADPDNTYYYYRGAIEQKLGLIKGLIISNSAQASSEAADFVQWLDNTIEQRVIPSIRYVYQQRENGYDIVNEQNLLKLSHLFRLCNLYSAAGSWLKWISSWNTELGLHKSMVNKVQDLSVNLIDLPGSEISINSLVQSPSNYDHQEVVISGKVIAIENTIIEGDKPVSSLVLESPEGNQIKASIAYINSDTQGIIVGSFCKLSGLFLVNNPNHEGDSGVTIKRTKLTALDGDSFNAWLRLNVNTLFELVPHNLAVISTIEKGSSGIATLISYDVAGKKVNKINKLKKYTKI